MNQQIVLEFTLKALLLVLFLSLPPILLATMTGLMVSLLQALTQIQEQTLGFAVKLIVVVVTLVFASGWMAGELLQFGQFIFTSIPLLTR